MLNGEYVVVEQVQHELLESPETTYNFEVEDFHTYYVGDISVLVHNACKAAKKAGLPAKGKIRKTLINVSLAKYSKSSIIEESKAGVRYERSDNIDGC